MLINENYGGMDRMTERFMVDDCGTLIDMQTRDTFDYVSDVCSLLNELHKEVMDLRRENTKFKLTVSEIIEDMQKYVDDNQLVYINQSYVDWIKKEVDTTLYSQKNSPRVFN
jgi:hypothetical protein